MGSEDHDRERVRDIVERLRETIVAYDEWYQGRLKTSDTLLERFSCERKEAADEITRLRAENEKLRAALKPFANAVLKDEYSWKYDINSDDFRVAAAAIRESGDE